MYAEGRQNGYITTHRNHKKMERLSSVFYTCAFMQDVHAVTTGIVVACSGQRGY
jgi:hypothetical protein